MWELLVLSLLKTANTSFVFSSFLLVCLSLMSVMKACSMSTFSYSWALDSLGLFLVFLSAIVVFLCFILKQSQLLLLLMFSLSLFFSTKKIIMFYLAFELSMLPAFLLMFTKGKKPERLKALQNLMVYTIMGSFPLIFSLLQNLNLFKSMSLLSWSLPSQFLFIGSVTTMFLVFAFFIKLPLFGLHKWLPKAHVEAPTPGSMILAALLLKMGSYGLYRFCLSFCVPYGGNLLTGWVMISLMVVSFICFRISDMKMLIAFSSVNHMLIMAYSWLLFSYQNLYFSVLLSVSHGFISSGLFLMMGGLYENSSSRSIFFKKGVNSIYSVLKMFWFCLLAANCSAPTSLSLFSEMFMFGHMLDNILSTTSMILFVFFSGLYCIYLYMVSFHGDFLQTVSSKTLKFIYYLLSLIHLSYSFIFVFFLFSQF